MKETGPEVAGQGCSEKDIRFYYIEGIFFNDRVAKMKQAANALGIQIVSVTGSGGTTEDGVRVKENEMQVEIRTMSADDCTRFWAKVDELS